LRVRPLDLVLILFVCLIWATNYFVIKAVLPYVDPITFAFLRAILGGIFIFAIGGYAVKGMGRKDLLWLVALGLFNVTLFLVFLNVSLVTANAGVDSTLVYTQPVFVAALATLVGERLTRNRVAGIAAAFAGIVVIFLPSIVGSTLVIGDLFLDPVPLFWVLLGYNVVLASGLAYVIFWRILSRMPASQFTSYFFLVPAFAVIMASVLQLSVPPPNEIAGTLLVALGIIAVNR